MRRIDVLSLPRGLGTSEKRGGAVLVQAAGLHRPRTYEPHPPAGPQLLTPDSLFMPPMGRRAAALLLPPLLFPPLRTSRASLAWLAFLAALGWARGHGRQSVSKRSRSHGEKKNDECGAAGEKEHKNDVWEPAGPRRTSIRVMKKNMRNSYTRIGKERTRSSVLSCVTTAPPRR